LPGLPASKKLWVAVGGGGGRLGPGEGASRQPGATGGRQTGQRRVRAGPAPSRGVGGDLLHRNPPEFFSPVFRCRGPKKRGGGGGGGQTPGGARKRVCFAFRGAGAPGPPNRGGPVGLRRGWGTKKPRRGGRWEQKKKKTSRKIHTRGGAGGAGGPTRGQGRVGDGVPLSGGNSLKAPFHKPTPTFGPKNPGIFPGKGGLGRVAKKGGTAGRGGPGPGRGQKLGTPRKPISGGRFAKGRAVTRAGPKPQGVPGW